VSWVIFNVVERITQYSRKQESKLGEAIANNDTASLKKLLKQGINPRLETLEKDSEPLIFAIFAKSYFRLPQKSLDQLSNTLYQVTAKKECLRLLLEYGVNPNLQDSCGRTPLEIAIIWCMPDIVKLLLIHGADPNLTDSKGLTPLMKTAVLGIQDARPINDKLQIMMHLIDSGAEIDAQTPDGKTALMYATGNSRIEIVELLVSSGASLSISDRFGHQACDIIDQGVTPQQRVYLQRILTQPQLNVLKYKYQEFIPEGNRFFDSIL
jgi:uncharacterized protein